MDCSRAATRDPDRWLDLAPDFSQPLARQVRDRIQRWQPDWWESIKWNMLCFSGHKQVCGLSACKRHLGITFFRGAELSGAAEWLGADSANPTARVRTLRVTTLEDFDWRAFRQLLQAADELDARVDLPPPPSVKREELPMPEALARALKAHPVAAAGFAAMKPTYQREYKVWIHSAKRPETLEARLQQTLRALAAGKKWVQRREA